MSFTADYNDLQAGNCTSNGTIDMVPQVGAMLA
jgi:hypothetical protein